MGTIAAAALAGACGGGGGDAVVTTQPQSYLQELPTWAQYSPPAQSVTPTTTGKTSDSTETIENVPVIDPVTQAVVGYRTEAYNCTTAEFTMTDTPEKIVMFSPDREVLWPGGLLQGKSHRDGVGSLLPLTIHERAAIKVSIPSLATADNFRVVDVPDQAEVNRAIGAMISNAHTSNLVTPSTIQFSMEDFNSEQAFALQAKVSGRYLGFSGSASASVARNANEHTVMVHFYEKMFEVVVEPPPTPAGFFSAEFTGPRLAEQIALGKIGPDNPPVYVSNVVYGRMMAFTFTSTATRTEIKSALNAAYKGIFSASASLSHQQRKVLEEARIAITSLGGQSKATTAMIASGDWKQYFSENAPLTSAYPISYTFRNLRDGSIAKVSESTRYDIKECQLKGSAFTGFVLDSFETQGDFDQWASSGSGLTLAWGAPSTPQSIFYGYVHAKHLNKLVNQNFLYDVHYLTAPPHFRGNRSDFYKGELSFWFKPDERFYTQNLGTVCVPFFLFGQICLPGLVADDDPVVGGDFRVRVVDDVTTFDQVVLRGGDPPFAVLTLTYNPKDNDVPLSWKRHGIPLTNDALLNSTCDRNDPVRRGCWLIEDQVAGEEQIKYVLAKVTDFRIRASYPLQRKVCVDSPAPVPPAVCATRDFVPFGYVGGFVDEVKLNKSAL